AKAPTCTEAGYEAYEYCSVCDYTTYKEIAATGHSYTSAETKAPTCTEKGEMTYTCTCGHSYTEEIAAKGHTLTQVEAKAPTCTEAGYEAYEYCSVCDYTTYKEIAAKGHSYTSAETKAPTCTEKGEMTYTCACGHSYTEEIAAKGHTLTQVEAKAPTCTEAGYEAYEYCSACDYTTYKEVAATGHSYTSEETKAPTCTEKGEKTFTCTCGDTYTEEIAAKGHTLTQVEAKAPTCTEAGYEAYEYCSVCDYTTYKEVAAKGHSYTSAETKAPTCTEKGIRTFTCQNDANHTYVEDIAPLGHIDANNNGYCDRCNTLICDHKDQGTHITDTKNETCTEDGYTGDIRCDKCNEITVMGKVIPAKNHAWTVTYSFAEDGKSCTATRVCANDAAHNVTVNATITSAVKISATCEGKGTTTYTATFDVDWAETKTKDVEDIPATGNHSYTVYVKTVAPGCTEQGYDEYKCATCTLTEKQNYTPAAHKEEKIPAVEPTCTDTGLTEGKRCSVCKEILLAQTVVAAKGHSEETIAGKAASCTEAGLTEGKKCSVCGTVTVEQEIISANGHTEATREEPVKDATCGEDGSYNLVTYCSVCKEVLKTEPQTIPATGEHSYTSEVTSAPTCQATGVRTYICSKCNDTYTEEIEALEHNLVQVPAKEPTSTEAGWYAYEYCVNCDYTTKVIRPAVEDDGEHEFVWSPQARFDFKDSTCSEEGYKRYYCSCSDGCIAAYIDEVIPKKEHSYECTVIAPTCVNGGETIYTCKYCSSGYSTDYTDALGHDYGKTVIAPTCENRGYTKYDCKRCTETFIGDLVDAKGHLDSDGNGLCDDCAADMIGSCSCLCHSTNWFLKIIYKIVCFIWKLFKISPVCGCGVVHY
ncbi:MAG: hypothetical protein IKK60_02235, partial [Clostridia bacterium]|nr:hypothetical protein [Clostridia bacterium]